MTHHSQLNLIMLATIIGLAIFLYLRPQFQPETDAAFQTLRDPDTVQTIRIIRHDEEAILQRIDGNWHLSSPYHARADESIVEKILNILSANSRQRFPLTNGEDFNLDKPLIELYLDEDYFAFGGLAPTTDQQYLAINRHVYLVSPRYAIWIPVKPLDIVSVRLLEENEIPVTFEFHDFLIQRNGTQTGEWRIVSQADDHLTTELMIRWAELWHSSRPAELIVDQHDRLTAQPIARIILQHGQAIQFSVVESENDNGVIIFRDNEQVGYYFPELKGRQLLNPYAFE
ncbi:MAG: DUF4340 domain-containing protein [Nitrosomonas sp.]|nr:DUF4340 domain-containing protein [Nitrosomonas sp.]